MKKIQLDNRLTSYILEKFSFFKFISPNIITISGILVNFLIYITIINNQSLATFVLLLYRYLADCLDGGVARKYNKSSKIGGFLDTISDNLLIFILTLSICTIYEINNKIVYSSILTLLNIFEMIRRKSVIDHNNIKIGGNIIEEAYSFMVNNSFIMFIFAYILCIVK